MNLGLMARLLILIVDTRYLGVEFMDLSLQPMDMLIETMNSTLVLAHMVVVGGDGLLQHSDFLFVASDRGMVGLTFMLPLMDL